MHIYHITAHADWQRAETAGQYTAPSLSAEGFIHASTREQVLATANRYYPGQNGLVLLVIDTDKLQPELRFDRVTLHGAEEHYPHIYGPINLDAVVDVLTLTPAPDGSFNASSHEKTL